MILPTLRPLRTILLTLAFAAIYVFIAVGGLVFLFGVLAGQYDADLAACYGPEQQQPNP